MSISKTSIIRLFSTDKLEEGMHDLVVLAEHYDPHLHNKVLAQKGRLAAFNNTLDEGILTPAEITRERNVLRNAFIRIVERHVADDWSISDAPDRAPGEGQEVAPSETGRTAPGAGGSVPATQKHILILQANPRDTVSLRVGEEVRKIKDELARTAQRDRFSIISEPAVRIHTITGAMQRVRPQIVHFSGHGAGVEGISIENEIGEEELFPNEGLERLFRLFGPTTECLLLNACYSEEQAKVIAKHVPYVIGMNDEIDDDASIDFAVGFYQSLGEGNDIEFAFEIAMINISVHLTEANKPVLWKDGQPNVSMSEED